MTINRKSISNTKDWNTPPEIIAAVKEVFGGEIDFDPCSNEYSMVGAKENWMLPEHDGLKEEWSVNTIYINPPFGREKGSPISIRTWLEKCSQAHLLYTSQVIALVPVATNTKHWQDNIFRYATSICFLQEPRLKFWYQGEPVKKGAPMACCCVYWGYKLLRFWDVFGELGKVLEVT